MTEYRCLVVNTEGRRDWRRIDGVSERAVLKALAAEDVVPVRIKSGAMDILERLNQPVTLGKGITIHEQALVMTQLATLIASGLPVDRSLDLLRDQAPRARLRDRLGRVLSEVRGGASLGLSFERQDFLPGYASGVIRASELSGNLTEALHTLAVRMTLNATTRRQLVTALAYPAAVLAATLLALALVLIMIVPQFEPLFQGQEDRLPTLTQTVLALSQAVRFQGGWLVGGALLLVLAVAFVLRSPFLAGLVERHREYVPGLALRDQYVAAQFSGLIATMVGNGVAVVRALPLASSALASRRWARHLVQVEREVREGRPFSAALMQNGLVPETAIRLIETGERSGRLAEACAHASSIMGEAARARIEWIVALANPIAIICLGGIVAVLVAGVMLGIFALGDFAG